MRSKASIMVVVGTPGSGKDILIQAVNDLGTLHARIVPKHTTRRRQKDDGGEMICSDDARYDLDGCDIKYRNYGDSYGMKSSEIWSFVRDEICQVIVISNVTAINSLLRIFGDLIKLVFVHSEIDREQYRKEQAVLGKPSSYIESRFDDYDKAFNMYYSNFTNFSHVLIYANSKEDFFDQIFRLFTHYEAIGQGR
jgi:ABC-type dipeptide/oligopeptide/nickel transport system ATPase component